MGESERMIVGTFLSRGFNNVRDVIFLSADHASDLDHGLLEPKLVPDGSLEEVLGELAEY